MKTLKISAGLATLPAVLFVWLFITSSGIPEPFDTTVNENETSVQQNPGLPTPEQPGIDVLQQIIAINSPNNPAPPTSFRNGHVTKATISDYLSKQEKGFEIKLPNQTNVPTACIYNGTCYVSGGFGSKQYYAFNAKTGEKLWAIQLDDDGPSCAAIADDIIVFNTESCTIFACDAHTGEHLWSYWLGDPLTSMPAIANGMVFTAYPAYGQASGVQHQSVNLNGLQYNENNQQQNVTINKKDTAGPDSLINIRATHALVAFDLKTGKIIWQKLQKTGWSYLTHFIKAK